MFRSLNFSDLDFVDGHAEIFLAMAGAFVAAFAPAEVRGIKLFALDDGVLCGGFEGGDDLSAFEVWGAYFDVFAIADEKDLVQLNLFGVGFDVCKLDIERVALADLMLLTALFNYCVHNKRSSV